MSIVSNFLQQLEGNLAQSFLVGALANNTTTAVQSFLANMPAATLQDAEAYIQGQSQQLIADATKSLPAWEQEIVALVDTIEQPKLNAYINSIVAPIYVKAISQLEGSTAGTIVKASENDSVTSDTNTTNTPPSAVSTT